MPPQNGEPEIKTKRKRQCDGGRKTKIYDFTAFLKEKIGTSGTEAVSTIRDRTCPRWNAHPKAGFPKKSILKGP